MTAFLWILAKPFLWFWNSATPKMKLVVIGVVLVLLTVGYIGCLRSTVRDLQDDKADLVNQKRQAVAEGKVNEANIIQVQIDEVDVEIEKSKANTAKVDKEAENVQNLDSSKYDPTDNDTKFCLLYQNDSTCVEFWEHNLSKEDGYRKGDTFGRPSGSRQEE